MRQLAAAFLPASLLAGISTESTNSQPASWLASKRQQAAALQSGLRPHPYWVWDTGLLQHIIRNPAAFAAELESRITPQDEAEWQKGSIEDWVMEGHRLAQTVAYGDLSNDNPPPITPAYERQADPVIDLQLEKAGVRLAYLLNTDLK